MSGSPYAEISSGSEHAGNSGTLRDCLLQTITQANKEIRLAATWLHPWQLYTPTAVITSHKARMSIKFYEKVTVSRSIYTFMYVYIYPTDRLVKNPLTHTAEASPQTTEEINKLSSLMLYHFVVGLFRRTGLSSLADKSCALFNRRLVLFRNWRISVFSKISTHVVNVQQTTLCFIPWLCACIIDEACCSQTGGNTLLSFLRLCRERTEFENVTVAKSCHSQSGFLRFLS